MYKFERCRQSGLADFNQPAGLKMDPENRWVRKTATIPWEAIGTGIDLSELTCYPDAGSIIREGDTILVKFSDLQ